MIRFSGEISGDCLKYILRRNAKADRFAVSLGLLLFGVPITVALGAMDWRFVFLCLPIFILAIAFCNIPPRKKDLGALVPKSVVIDPHTRELISQNDKLRFEAAFSLVKEIWDFGDWYDIRTETDPGWFICQKNLLCEGTLEEFEALFADKLIKKTVKS